MIYNEICIYNIDNTFIRVVLESNHQFYSSRKTQRVYLKGISIEKLILLTLYHKMFKFYLKTTLSLKLIAEATLPA